MASSPVRDAVKTARLFHALADETRLDIVELLTKGEQCVCDLTDHLDTGQSRLSFHLRTLKEAGLVKDRREGRWNYYSLDRDALEEIAQIIQDIKRRTAGQRAPACE